MPSTLIQVTQSDIDEGKMCPSGCPVARALERVSGCDVVVARLNLALYDKASGRMLGSCALPVEIIRWLEIYDAGETVEPISFTIWLETSDA